MILAASVAFLAGASRPAGAGSSLREAGALGAVTRYLDTPARSPLTAGASKGRDDPPSAPTELDSGGQSCQPSFLVSSPPMDDRSFSRYIADIPCISLSTNPPGRE